MTSGKWLIVFSTKVNLLYLVYSMAWRCCPLHLIKQNSEKVFGKLINNRIVGQLEKYGFFSDF